MPLHFCGLFSEPLCTQQNFCHGNYLVKYDDRMNSELASQKDVNTASGQVAYFDSGVGLPAVVFIGGAGGLAIFWEPVRTVAAETTRALAFDRPGYGRSTPRKSGFVTSPHRLADELHETLLATSVESPFILVAHSFGAFIARAFAAAHPGKLAGLVLVDPAHEDEWTDAYPESHRKGQAFAARGLAFIASVSLLGLPQLLARLPFIPMGDVDLSPKELRVSARRLAARRSSLRTAASEFAALESAAAEMTGLGNLGDLPLIVIAHRKPGPLAPGTSAEDAARMEAAAQSSLRSMAKSSSRGELLPTTAGHEIHLENPEVVIGAVVNLLDF